MLVVRGARGDEVSRAWQGKTVVLVASGPSMTLEALEVVRLARERDAVRVIAINDMYLVAPWADVLYFADHKWWKWHTDGIAKAWPWARFSADEVKAAFAAFQGQKVTIKHNPMATGQEIFSLRNDGPDGMSTDPTGIMTGSNSGHQALNIAALSGASTVLLVGYDMKFAGARSHSHNGHPQAGQVGADAYKNFAHRFAKAEAALKKMGVEVFNCTPDSALKAFPHRRLEEVLCPAQASA